jgi:hypothetical protein
VGPEATSKRYPPDVQVFAENKAPPDMSKLPSLSGIADGRRTFACWTKPVEVRAESHVFEIFVQ